MFALLFIQFCRNCTFESPVLGEFFSLLKCYCGWLICPQLIIFSIAFSEYFSLSSGQCQTQGNKVIISNQNGTHNQRGYHQHVFLHFFHDCFHHRKVCSLSAKTWWGWPRIWGIFSCASNGCVCFFRHRRTERLGGYVEFTFVSGINWDIPPSTMVLYNRKSGPDCTPK